MVAAFLLVIVAFVLGIVLRGRFPVTAPATLNAWVMQVALPALVLKAVPAIPYSADAIVVGLMPWVTFLGALAGGVWVGRLRGWSRGTTGAVVLTAGLGNTAFVGLPLVTVLIGAEAVPLAVVADQLGSFAVFSTLAIATAAAFAGSGVALRTIVWRLVTFPAMPALFIGLVARSLGGWPLVLNDLFAALAATMTPLALFSVGLQLRVTGLAANADALVAALGYKLVLAPLAVFGIVRGLGVEPMAAEVAVAQCAMAPMVTAGILAQEYDLDPQVATGIVGVGIPVSFLSVAGLLRLLFGA